MDDNVRIATNGRGEVRVEWDVESIVAVLRDVQHTRTEVLRAGGGLLEKEFQDAPSSRILDGLERLHDSAYRRCVDGVTKTSSTLGKCILQGGQLRFGETAWSITDQTTVNWTVMAPEHGLLREVNSNLLRDSNVGHEHQLRYIH